MGRFRYSDLKEAALSGAGGLWELDRLELVVAAKRSGILCSERLLTWKLMPRYGLRPMVGP